VTWTTNQGGQVPKANSGQANAQTSPDGLKDCEHSAHILAKELHIDPETILLASTGFNGQPLNLKVMDQAIPKLVKSLSPSGLDDFAHSIMNTDKVPKVAEAQGAFSDGTEFHIWGAAKGSGMIAPNMATMLDLILTDANLDPAHMQSLLKKKRQGDFQPGDG
jgi:glutamate N-acetyltransferase/amino-acid N-acetyltransferase